MLKNIMNYAGIFACLGIGAAAQAEEAVNITPELSAVTVETGQGPVEISRIQDVDNVLTGAFARTSRPCPNFCIQPMQAAPG